MNRIWITGYRNYELGIFKNDDAKVKIIKQIIKRKILEYVEDGLEWVISGGNLGVEQWASEVVCDLKNNYEDQMIKNAIILPFEDFGNAWKENNKENLFKLLNEADFHLSLSQDGYKSPIQFKNYQKFMLKHTDKALLIYDSEHLGKSQYDLNKIIEYNKQNPSYDYEIIDFYELQELANEIQYKEY
ncbi:hypothetical protein FD06_GL000141 [Apilactobacillus ozensis DSM 23829 = JCM 17196]|uniref:UPF0398 protein FD06_GL000141 n=1 Tax=Apilactobacillus ozensis DSM 23829 = JCM 17196 TaxID=1423781 RepID=A0A0R2AMC8_9LACO|nr:SLOG family protein [Apilactobacillus ozensis]KRM68023.1 hypothetical protein FD06_GL000141 [Apilactobacillus ozensis DSM 23829 = JCM 17196]